MIVFYFEKQWWDGDPLTPTKKRKPLAVQPKKPPIRPKWWVEFTDVSFNELRSDFDTSVGRINHVILDTTTGEHTFVIHVLWTRFDVTREQILHRVAPVED